MGSDSLDPCVALIPVFLGAWWFHFTLTPAKYLSNAVIFALSHLELKSDICSERCLTDAEIGTKVELQPHVLQKMRVLQMSELS